jgi:hypothetical protein
VYGSGRILTFIQILPAVIGPIGFGFAIFGTATMLRHGRSGWGSLRCFFVSHRARCRTLAWSIPWGVLMVHSLLWVTGKMASNGEPRYLLIAAPFWAMLAGAGLERLSKQFSWKQPLIPIAVGAALPVIANLIYPCFPLGPQNDDRLAERVAGWLDEHPALRQQYPRTFAWSPHLFFKLDVDKLNDRVAGQLTRSQVQTAPVGSLLVWDSVYSVFNSSYEYVVPRQLLIDAGWRPVWNYTIDPDAKWAHTVEVFVSPQDAKGNSIDTVK